MWFKNGRIIIDEDILWDEIEELKYDLQEFFETDPRFRDDDIEVCVNFETECCNEYDDNCWNELCIEVINHDRIVELKGELSGQKAPATAYITYTTDSLEPKFVMNCQEPEFYHVFNWASSTIINAKTWENGRCNCITIEDIVINWMNGKFGV